jgi:non-ribosomal peptide synthetase-like protein
VTTLQEADQLLGPSSDGPAVLVAADYAQGSRARRGERLDHVFEERCDWMRSYGRAGHLAVDAGDVTLTFPELDESANRLARYLLAAGARPGDRIALLFDQAVHSYIAMLAVLKINAAYVPLDVGFPSDRIAYIISDAGARMVLSLSHVRDRVEGLEEFAPGLLYVDQAAGAIALQNPARLTDTERGLPVEDLAYLIYTSGTTGRPKGVAIEHASICNFVRVAAEVYGIRTQDRVYQGMTIAFDFSVEEIWVPWVAGATLVPKPAGSSLLGLDLHAFLTDRRITALCCVPTLLATIEEDLPELRFLLVSGEACPQDLIARWHRPGRRFLNVYGPTEATVTATWTTLHPDRPVTIGQPLPTYTTVTLDPENPFRALPHGEVGEIGIAGIGLATGYLNRDDLTDKAFIPDFLGIAGNPSGRIYRTGDLGRVNAAGEIEYLGRIDLQVKIRGYRIELTEIESVLLQVPGIAAAVVDTFEPTPGTVELVGYYSLRTGVSALDPEVITAHLRERLPSYMVPAYLEHLAAIPMTTSDKADRKALPTPTARRAAGPAGEHVAAATDTERVLADALARTLGLDQVSVDSHFFDDLSANSLLMAQFSALVRKETALPSLSMREVYQNPTVRQLAKALGGATPMQGGPAPTGSVVRGSTAGYLMVGALQLLAFLAFAYLGALVLETGFVWSLEGTTTLEVFGRSALYNVGAYLAACLLPILAKWIMIGRWKEREIRLWSLGYLRFWTVKTLIRANPLVLFAGSPLYTLYLRALGAKIGRGTTVLSRNVPVATDLITIGAGTIIRRDSSFTGYRAVAGAIQIGRVTVGRDVFIGEKTVLDVDTAIGDGAQLGHTSSVHSGQRIPAGERWHGVPAEPTTVDYRVVEPVRCGALRRFTYSALQLLGALVLAPVVGAVLIAAATTVPSVHGVVGEGHDLLITPSFYLTTAAITLGLFIGGTIGALALMIVGPRVLSLAVRPGATYPLYGFRWAVARSITGLTNSGFFMTLFGDSSAAVGYLRAIGYRMPQVEQTGSNFGTELKQDSSLLTTIGTGTMVSDALSIMNADFSATSFRMSHVSIGAHNFIGNNIAFPTDARIGENVLLGTKVMVPMDGPVRQNVGLLGSPSFEIPRTVARDTEFDHLKDPSELRRRLSRKNRHNAVSMLVFLAVRWFQVYVSTLLFMAAADLHYRFGELGIAVSVLAVMLFNILFTALVERAVLGFRALQPRFVSIYDPYFWGHERLWKLGASALFSGTPFKNVIWRLLGVRIGRRVFDDGCAIPEKTLVTLGDDAVLNAGSVIQCHSLEDGSFKSGYTVVGAGAVVGVEAFVHYGVTMGDGAVVDSDAFLMKGETVAPFAIWQGNPATEVRAVAIAPAPAAPAAPVAHRLAPARPAEPLVTATYKFATPPAPAVRPVPAAPQAPLTAPEIAMTVVPTTPLQVTAPAPAPRPTPGPVQRPAIAAAPVPAARPADRPSARPHVATPLPGPRSAELLARQEQRESNARVYPRHFPFAVAEASGSYIRDLDGNLFIDFLSGAGVLSLGHNHPELVAAATEQMGIFTHGLDMPSPAKDAFTDAQLSMLPASMRDRMKIQFCGPTGANAVDAALKLCKTATGRGGVVSFQGGFHGSSHAAMAMTGKVSQKRPITNGMPGVSFFPFSSCSRCPLALDPETCQTNCVSFLERALRDPNGGLDLPAAVIMEMVQGEGGVIPARKEFVQRVRQLTRELGIPLIVDEVQTGCGRTGTWFAFEQYDIEPDVIVASKALSGMGLPVAIVLYAEELDTWAPGAHSGTFRGNQLAFAAGAKSVEIIQRDDVLGNVVARGEQVAGRLAGLASHPGVLEVRGKGLMWGIELNAPGDGRTVTELAEEVQARALRSGLIVELGGRDDCVVRMLPPLNVTAEVVDIALSILLHAIEGAYVGVSRAA